MQDPKKRIFNPGNPVQIYQCSGRINFCIHLLCLTLEKYPYWMFRPQITVQPTYICTISQYRIAVAGWIVWIHANDVIDGNKLEPGFSFVES